MTRAGDLIVRANSSVGRKDIALVVDRVRERLCAALIRERAFVGLRASVAALISDLACGVEEAAPDTVKTFGAPWDGDCAPPTPRESEIGEEYGV